MALAAQYERLDNLWERRLCLQHNQGLFKGHMQKLHTGGQQDVHLKYEEGNIIMSTGGAMNDCYDIARGALDILRGKLYAHAGYVEDFSEALPILADYLQGELEAEFGGRIAGLEAALVSCRAAVKNLQKQIPISPAEAIAWCRWKEQQQAKEQSKEEEP